MTDAEREVLKILCKRFVELDSNVMNGINETALWEEEANALSAFAKSPAEHNEGYPASWERGVFMVSESGEIHQLAGKRESGDGDTRYLARERIMAHWQRKAESPAEPKPAMTEEELEVEIQDACLESPDLDLGGLDRAKVAEVCARLVMRLKREGRL